MPYCSICTNPARLAFVDEQRALGASAYRISVLSRDPGAQDRGVSPMKDMTVVRHYRHTGGAPTKRSPEQAPKAPRVSKTTVVSPHVSPPRDVSPPPEVLAPSGPRGPLVLPKGDVSPPVQNAKDVAMLVAEKALEGIEDGSLRVTTAHGLQAQAMLDRREERRKDRELAIAMGRLLSGAMRTPAHLILDGTAVVVTDEEEATPGMLADRA